MRLQTEEQSEKTRTPASNVARTQAEFVGVDPGLLESDMFNRKAYLLKGSYQVHLPRLQTASRLH